MTEQKRKFKVRLTDGRYLFAVNQLGACTTINYRSNAPLLTESEIEEYKRRMAEHSLSRQYELILEE